MFILDYIYVEQGTFIPSQISDTSMKETVTVSGFSSFSLGDPNLPSFEVDNLNQIERTTRGLGYAHVVAHA